MQIGKKKVSLAPEMFGLFFEDINYAADGGLFAELIENRSFESKEAFGTPGALYTTDDFLYGWSAVKGKNGNTPRLQVISGTPLSTINPHYLRITATEDGQGVSNKCYDGLSLTKGQTYHVSFYARCVRYDKGDFKVGLEKDGKTLAENTVSAVRAIPYLPFGDLPDMYKFGDTPVEAEKVEGKTARCNDWILYKTDLVASETVDGAVFTLCLEKEGIAEFDLVSMIPSDAVEGVFRKDLFDALKNIHPGFVRFPGGCIVEGISLDNRYRWKQTVGEWKDRRYIPNLWAFEDNRSRTEIDTQRGDPHYGQSYGIGFYEYFLLCEKIGAKPLPVLSMGGACQFRSTEIISSDSDDFDEYVQDALDLIEFANGSTDTTWGKLRKKMGHEKPFNLEFLAIGNEQWETRYFDVMNRYKLFEKAIHNQYPQMKLLGTAGPMQEGIIAEKAWAEYRSAYEKNPSFCYAVDEHYYMPPQWMYDRIDLYDRYPRNVAVFAGEYAAHTPDRQNSMESALAEAAMLTGMERNGDIVKLAAYAPLFHRNGHSQWVPDMIWFDARNTYLTPNYYVQQLFASHNGEYTLDLAGQEAALRQKKIYVSAVGKNDKTVILKLVNSSEQDFELPLTNHNGAEIKADAKQWTLKGSGKFQFETLEESSVSEEKVTIDGSLTIPARTVVVVEFSAD